MATGQSWVHAIGDATLLATSKAEFEWERIRHERDFGTSRPFVLGGYINTDGTPAIVYPDEGKKSAAWLSRAISAGPRSPDPDKLLTEPECK